eukprot:3556010-Amphidinium_carterae.1
MAAVKSLFQNITPLDTVPADPESNPDNFHGKQQVWYEPSSIPVYRGMRLTFTQNVNKEHDYVN